MADELADWWVHTVQVATYLGAGRNGDVWADAVPVQCWVEDIQKLVRDTKSGEQIVSSTTIDAPLSTADTFTVGSRVTLPSGRVSRVLACGREDPGSLDLPAHTEVTLE